MLTAAERRAIALARDGIDDGLRRGLCLVIIHVHPSGKQIDLRFPDAGDLPCHALDPCAARRARHTRHIESLFHLRFASFLKDFTAFSLPHFCTAIHTVRRFCFRHMTIITQQEAFVDSRRGIFLTPTTPAVFLSSDQSLLIGSFILNCTLSRKSHTIKSLLAQKQAALNRSCVMPALLSDSVRKVPIFFPPNRRPPFYNHVFWRSHPHLQLTQPHVHPRFFPSHRRWLPPEMTSRLPFTRQSAIFSRAP